MKELKFELSIIFTKFKLDYFSDVELIKKEYKSYFKKEVDDVSLNEMLGEIIEDNFNYHGNSTQEIPEDFELINVNNDIRDR